MIVNDGKKGIIAGFRSFGTDRLDYISKDLGLGLDALRMDAIRQAYLAQKADPTVAGLRFDAEVAKLTSGADSVPLTGEISFGTKTQKAAFSKLVSASGLARKNPAGLSISRLAEYSATGGRAIPRSDVFEICEAERPVFPAFPSCESTVLFAGDFRIGINRNPPRPAPIQSDAAVLVFPSESMRPYEFIKAAEPFAARLIEKGRARVIPCGGDGLLFDLFEGLGSFRLRTDLLPGKPESPDAALLSYAPAFVLAMKSADIRAALDEAARLGFRARQIATKYSERDAAVLEYPSGQLKITRKHLSDVMLFRRAKITSESSEICLPDDGRVYSEDAVRASGGFISGDVYEGLSAAFDDSDAIYAVCGSVGNDGASPALCVALDAVRREKSPRVAAASFFPSRSGKTTCAVIKFTSDGEICGAGEPPALEPYGYHEEPAVRIPDFSALPGRGKIYKDAASLCGSTPLLEVYPGKTQARILCKLELFNPAGSAKDRVALNIIRRAKEDGRLPDGGVIIEATSGNTGIGLAAYGRAAGYRVIIVMPDSMSRERVDLMRAYGAEVILTSGAGGMSAAAEEAERIHAQTPGSFVASQFDNPANPEAHELTTGPEIYKDTEGKADILVAGIGTGGTLCGSAKYLKKMIPGLCAVGCEPASSPLITEGRAGKHAIAGIGANFIPANYDPSVVDEVLTVTDEEASQTAAKFAADYGLLVGVSSGCALSAALKLAALPENAGKTIVAVLPDTGEHYISTGLFGK